MTPTPLHPDLKDLTALIGEWSGDGLGTYPTINDFGYHETATFSHGPKPFLAYAQRTTATDDDAKPLHVETGYWRLPQPGRVELVCAHPTGVVEVAEGTIATTETGLTIALASTTMAGTASAKEVTAIERDLVVDGDVLRCEIRMAAMGIGLTHHLAATLVRRPV